VLANALKGNAELARRVWEFLDSIPPETLLGEGRVYRGGLYKVEPNVRTRQPRAGLPDPFVEHRRR
jgi:hypothetical protein